MKLDPLLQVASYPFSSHPSLRIFQQQSPPNAPIQNVLIAEPLLDWQRDDQGRPLINAVRGPRGEGAVFELRLIISSVESQQAAQRAVSTNPALQKMSLTTQIDLVDLVIGTGELGDLLALRAGTMYPSRNENVVVVDFESSSLTASKEDIEKVRSILRSVRLICKAFVNGHELPPISLDFSTIAPPSTAPPVITPPPPTSAPPRPSPAAVNNIVVADRPLRAPHSPRFLKMSFATVRQLAWTPSGNLVATTDGPNFYILKPNGEVIRQINSGSGLQELRRTTGVAVSAEGLIFISDFCTHCISVYTEEGRFVRSFGGPGNGIGQLSHPYSLAISKTGNVFVSDSKNHRIQEFEQTGKFVNCFGSGGSAPGQLNTPYGIDFDNDGNIIVAENAGQRISVFTSQGKFIRCFGSGGSLPGQFDRINQLFFHRPSGRIVVAEYGNKRIQILNQYGAVEAIQPNGMNIVAVVVDKDEKVIIGGEGSIMVFYNN